MPERAGVRPGRPDPRRARRVRLRARELARLTGQNFERELLDRRQEIVMLTNLRRLLYSRALNRSDNGYGSLEKIVREFYTLSDGGYYEVIWRQSSSTRPAEPIDMVQFMRTSFETTLAIGDGAEPTEHGLDDFLGMIGLMTIVLDSPQAQLLQAHVLKSETAGQAIVYAKSRCTCALTALLLDKVFPHVQAQAPWLRDKLIGRKIQTISEGQFTFDTASARIIRVNLVAEYAPSILDLAGSQDELKILKGETQAPRIVEITDSTHDESQAVSEDEGGSRERS